MEKAWKSEEEYCILGAPCGMLSGRCELEGLGKGMVKDYNRRSQREAIKR